MSRFHALCYNYRNVSFPMPLQVPTMNPQSAIEMVFVHGAGSNADFWHQQRTTFPGAHFLNLPGHGNSSPATDAPQQLEDYADWIVEYVGNLGLDNVVLNGHSMGGAITLMLALQCPVWLRGIILTSTGARLQVSHKLLEMLESNYPAAVDFIIEMSFAQQSKQPSYAQKVRMNGSRRQLLRTPEAITLADYQATQRFDITERAGEINIPTLILVGAEDRITPVHYSEYLHQAIGGSRLNVIEAAGHMLPLEKPDEYNNRVATFVHSLALQEE